MVCPGATAPRASASSISERATRSFTEPVGLWLSSFAQMRTPGFGESFFSSTSGVCPIASIVSPYLPPHGRLSMRGPVTEKRLAPGHRREDHQRVRVGQWRVETLEHAHVLVV